MFASLMSKKIIGRTDIANFPDLRLFGLSIKVDTGAFTSSIHCHEIEEFTYANGTKGLSFRLLDPEQEQYHDKLFKVKDFKKKWVKNSFGEREERYVIYTNIVLFHKNYPIELSLSNRLNMKYPVLLGRKALRHFLVDVTKVNMSFTHSLTTNLE